MMSVAKNTFFGYYAARATERYGSQLEKPENKIVRGLPTRNSLCIISRRCNEEIFYFLASLRAGQLAPISFRGSMFAPVAQWTEQVRPKDKMEVRFLSGAP
jgi:hypothetical protein